MTLHVTIVVGNPNPRSRTLAVAEALVQRLLDRTSYQLDIIDLADVGSKVFDWKDPEVAALNERVAASDLVLVASPTYKATYTGLLKAFLDRYPANGLSGVVTIPVMTGADPKHAMGVDVHLAPLLVELGATVPGRGVLLPHRRLGATRRSCAGRGRRVRGEPPARRPRRVGSRHRVTTSRRYVAARTEHRSERHRVGDHT